MLVHLTRRKASMLNRFLHAFTLWKLGYRTLFLVFFFLSGLAYPISFEYINSKFPDTQNLFRIDTLLISKINPLLYSVSKSDTANNTIVRRLQETFTHLRQTSTASQSKRTALLSGLTLLCLEHLGDTTAFLQAETLFVRAIQQFPATWELYWLHGLHCINTGKVIAGIRELDSLRLAGFNNKEFLSDYAQYVFRALTPQKQARVYFFRPTTRSSIIADTTAPESVSWNVVSGFDKNTSLPSFSYIERYSFRNPYTLMFSTVSRKAAKQPLLHMSQELVPSYITPDMIEQLTDRIGRAQCQVNIDLTNTLIPLQEYIINRIYNRYDSVRIVSDLPQYKALSLRCYARSSWGNSQGMYAGYVVFDRLFRDVCPVVNNKKSKSKIANWETIRYTIAVQSEINVESLTEAKLQSIIEMFR